MSVVSFLRGRVGMAALAVVPLVAPDQPVRVTQHDVDASNQKVAGAYSALVDMWTKDFQQIGARFNAPRLVRYTGSAMTACGVIRPNNAQYCSNANAIFYDEVFVAGMAKISSSQLGTDGDMTSVGIIAHEMGHAVAMELGYASRDSYRNESTADCLAGAFAKQAQRDGSLEKGDLEEAILGMQMAGDPEVQPTGNERYDRLIQARLSRQAHGTKEQRVQNFRTGFDGGEGACLDDFARIK